MASDEELQKSLEQTQNTLAMFAKIQEQAADFELRKQEFSRQFGVEFDRMAEWSAGQDTSQALRQLTPAQREQMEREKAAFESDLARELQAAEHQFRQQHNQGGTPPPRINRVRDMI